jgi:hypothetical protein
VGWVNQKPKKRLDSSRKQPSARARTSVKERKAKEVVVGTVADIPLVGRLVEVITMEVPPSRVRLIVSYTASSILSDLFAGYDSAGNQQSESRYGGSKFLPEERERC